MDTNELLGATRHYRVTLDCCAAMLDITIPPIDDVQHPGLRGSLERQQAIIAAIQQDDATLDALFRIAIADVIDNQDGALHKVQLVDDPRQLLDRVAGRLPPKHAEWVRRIRKRPQWDELTADVWNSVQVHVVAAGISALPNGEANPACEAVIEEARSKRERLTRDAYDEDAPVRRPNEFPFEIGWEESSTLYAALREAQPSSEAHKTSLAQWISTLQKFLESGADIHLTLALDGNEAKFMEEALRRARDRYRSDQTLFEADEAAALEYMLYEVSCFNSGVAVDLAAAPF